MNPIQIRPAESQAERENKIFVGMLPKTITELDLHNMFARYGQLKEVGDHSALSFSLRVIRFTSFAAPMGTRRVVRS